MYNRMTKSKRLWNGTKCNNTSSPMLLDHCYAFSLLLWPSGLKKKFVKEGDLNHLLWHHSFVSIVQTTPVRGYIWVLHYYHLTVLKNIVAAIRGMHVSPAKHSFGKCDRKVWQTDGQTDRQTDGQSDPYVSLCYAGDTKTGNVIAITVDHLLCSWWNFYLKVIKRSAE